MTELHKISLTNKIYSKKCPHCHKDNLESSAFCWNCNYEFPDAIAHTKEKEKHALSGVLVSLAFIAAIVILILIILDAIK